MITFLLVGICCSMVAAAAIVYKRKGRTLRSLPPGPRGLPIFGHGLGIKPDKAYEVFTQWGKDYGEVCMVKIFSKNVIIISRYEELVEMFQSQDLSQHTSDRPESFLGYYVASGYKDLLFREYDDICKRLKSVTFQAVHEFGEGSSNYERLALKVIQDVAQRIRFIEGRDFSIMDIINQSLYKLLAAVFVGELLEDDDPLLSTIKQFDHYGHRIVLPSNHSVLKLFPFLRHLPGKYGKMYRDIMKGKDNLRTGLVERMKKSYDRNHVTCFVHAFFRAQEKETWLTDDFILGVCMDLINTSLLTSKGILSGLLLLLLNYKEVQDKIREEISATLGNEKDISMSDLASLPYTHACILETLRYQSHLPLTATHSNNHKDIEFHGYYIPKGTAMFGNLWAIHHDERTWEAPWVFRPERFLQDNGSIVPADHELRKRLVPFGVGRRACIGQKMSYGRMLLYTATILRNFQLVPAINAVLPSSDPRELTAGTVLQAPTFFCRAISLENSNL
ncbi:hypothetical protein CHS0354_007149 [Potamilus streckersoni]|uniref:Cytochrome P450 n=1 Tax=Potamilus streckersoni TaxID=2493646 RepID=A0AAE0VU09_9BIVA|nr:hypothetical protein CHS0354_007149 [Potamilus streckersoni]